MPANTTIALSAGTWTALTDNGISAARVQNGGGVPIYIQATTGGVPASTDGAITLNSGSILPSSLSLADLFPGVTGASRIYAYALGAGKVSVSHA
jgi:hypothetical protein